jgi:transposase
MQQTNFHDLLRLVRRRYGSRPVWMLLDEAPCHIAHKSQALAATLDIHLVWLPKQCSELNSMDQLWKELKGTISANHQYTSIEEHVAQAEDWLLQLSKREALRKAGVLSKNFWLRSFLQ